MDTCSVVMVLKLGCVWPLSYIFLWGNWP